MVSTPSNAPDNQAEQDEMKVSIVASGSTTTTATSDNNGDTAAAASAGSFATEPKKESTAIDVPTDKNGLADAATTTPAAASPTPDDAPKPSVSASELFKYADRFDITLMIVGAACAFLGGAGMPGFSQVFSLMVQELLKPNADLEGTMAELAKWLCVIGVIIFILSWIQVSTFTIAAERQARRIRELYFEATLRQELGFHDEQKPGGLSARLFGDITVLRNGINDKLVAGMLNLGMFLFGFGLGFYNSWRLTLLMMGTLPFIAGAGAWFAKILEDSTKDARAGYAKAGDISDEVLKNIRTVQAFGTEAKECVRFNAALEEAAGHGIKKEFMTVGGVGVTYGIMFASYALAFWFASWLVSHGHNNIADVTSTFFSVLMASFGLGLIFPSVSALAEASGAAYKVYEIIDRESKIDPFTAGAKFEHDLKGEISFKNITFSYPTRLDEKLFSGVSFKVEAGQHVAFSGASGCGKSTFIGLAQRLYDPLEGSVEIDGHDLKHMDLDWWRSQLGVVSQEPTLFSGTIKDNVLLGKGDATDAEVVDACKKSNIHDTIMTLPDKYDTNVGSVGSQLSGGQKQRIAIARALIRKPRVLILDEATSALDRQSEIEVQKAIDDLMRSADGTKLTIMIIAHRLATIRHVDRIFFIENDGEAGSRISEVGTFDELIRKGGAFAAMASRQSKSMASLGEEDKEELQREHVERLRQESFDPEKFVPDDKKEKKDPLKDALEKELAEVDASMGRVFSLMPIKWPVFLALIGSTLAGGVYPFYAVVFAKVLEIIGKNETDKIALWACMFLVIAGGALIGWLLQGFYGYAGEYLTVILRRDAFSAILRQDMTFFDMPGRDAGSMQQLLSGDCEAVHQLWGPSIGTKIQAFCNLAAGLAIGFYYSWKLSLVTISCVPVMIVTGAVQQMMIQGFGAQAGDQTATVVTESLQNIRTVTAFNIHKRQLAMYGKSLEENEKAGIKLAIGSGLIFGISQFSFYGVFALALWYGGKLITQGELGFFDVIVTSMSVLMGAIGAGEAGGWAAKLKDSGAAAQRVFALIDRTPSIDIRQQGDKSVGKCDVEFQNVKFVYPSRPEAVVLKSFSTQIPSGRTLGLMGSTGCGKSTSVQLILRYYDPAEGEILVNGKNVKEIDLRTWRDQIAAVLQEPSLFSGTIRDNIKYVNPDATDDEVFKYAKLAAIHDDILAMDKGYETQVGYSGRNLSGGQKQRVALARALMTKKKILLLDEATSALDMATEARVQDGLAAALKEHPMTVVSIAHRLTTIRYSNKIMLLDNGVVLEEGTHEELIAKDGEYKKRWDTFNAGQQH